MKRHHVACSYSVVLFRSLFLVAETTIAVEERRHFLLWTRGGLDGEEEAPDGVRVSAFRFLLSAFL
jgi:hypothetical protein